MKEKIRFIAQKVAISLSKLFRVKNLIILESNPDFSDNTKVLFDEMIKNGLNNKYKIVWIFKGEESAKEIKMYEGVDCIEINQKGLIRRIITEVKLFIALSSCKYYFFSHQFHSKNPNKKNQKFVFLTHGFHFKYGVGRHFDSSKVSSILTLSDNDKDIAEKVYEVSREKLVNLGYSRNDLLFEKALFEESGLVPDFGNIEKLYLWLPTFRRHSNKMTNDSKRTEEQSDLPLIQKNEDFKRINDYLAKSDDLLIIKPHPAQDMTYFEVSDFSNIKIISSQTLLDTNTHLYTLLAMSDCLITDYSSVFVDYLLLNKPIIFTVDDLEMYGQNLGFMYDNYQDYMPGAKVKSVGELVDALICIKNSSDAYHGERMAKKQFFHANTTGSYSLNILEYFGLLKEEK